MLNLVFESIYQDEGEQYVRKFCTILFGPYASFDFVETTDTCQRDQNICSINGGPALLYRMVGEVALDRCYGRTI